MGDNHFTEPPFREVVSGFFQKSQQSICEALESLDGRERFNSDGWSRDGATSASSPIKAGGGLTRVFRQGRLFEQAGVNFSAVRGELPADMCQHMINRAEPQPFFATGVSLVIHPYSPMIPTTHANFRYLEVGDRSWFGGGMDLTPYYLFGDDAQHFHAVAKSVCDKHDRDYYPRFKKWCDEYFYLPHRGEARGVGGIFFDYLGRDSHIGSADESSARKYFGFVSEMAQAFVAAYVPIVQRRERTEWGESEKQFQLLRRGRYVEFNLICDRGTLFGLKTGGRTESILMSLPPQVRWEYNYQPAPASREEELLAVIKAPREWV